MNIEITALGAMIGLVIAIGLIFVKVPPVYGLLVGALVGGLVGGAPLVQTVELMVEGSQGMMTAILRILAAGILAGVLIESGAAEAIAQTIVSKTGEERALLALALATMLLTAVGVFIDIAIITVAPIALNIAQKAGLSHSAILLAMSGGGKAGNVMSPNPNTIAVSEAFDVPLTSVMFAGVIPAVIALFFTYFLAQSLSTKGEPVAKKAQDIEATDSAELPNFLPALSGPIAAVMLLSLRPIANIEIDPMIALPFGGLVGSIVMGQFRKFTEQATFGLSKMSPVAVLLIGTGSLAGIIANSALGTVLIDAVAGLGLPIYLLAPLSGIVMSGATSSTTSGAIVASSVFSGPLLASGFSPLGGATMINAGATVFDHLPHGSFFHSSGGSISIYFRDRLKLIPHETAVGLVITIVSVVMYGFLGFG